MINGDRTKCLGRSKGRQYPAMEEKSLKYLQRYYLSHNTALVKLFKKIGIRIVPNWLKDDLSDKTDKESWGIGVVISIGDFIGRKTKRVIFVGHFLDVYFISIFKVDKKISPLFFFRGIYM